MKSLLLALVLCSCTYGPTASDLMVDDAHAEHVKSTPRYNDKEVRCAQETITKLYEHSEQYGKGIFVFGVKSSDVWNDYLKCVIGH